MRRSLFDGLAQRYTGNPQGNLGAKRIPAKAGMFRNRRETRHIRADQIHYTKGVAMNVIKEVITDLHKLLAWIETELGMHPTQAVAAANIKAAATALSQHPDASVAPSTIVSPGKEDTSAAETDAPAPAADPANDAAEVTEVAPPAASETPATPAA